MVAAGRVSYVRANYLDTSALIKLLVDEPDGSQLKEYFERNNGFYVTSLCFAEALGVLKVKHFYREEITQKGYLNRSYLLTVLIRNRRVELDEVLLADPAIFAAVEEVIRKYEIDTADALQIVTIKNGRFSNRGGESRSLLITADEDLAKAARCEG